MSWHLSPVSLTTFLEEVNRLSKDLLYTNLYVCICVYGNERVFCYLPIAGSVVDQTGMLSGAAQLCDGLRLTHHPPHTLQMTVL